MFSFFKKKPKPEAIAPITEAPAPAPEASVPTAAPAPAPAPAPEPVPAQAPTPPALTPAPSPVVQADVAPVATPVVPAAPIAPIPAASAVPATPAPVVQAAPVTPEVTPEPAPVPAPVSTPTEAKRSWLSRLKSGLAKTSSNLTTLFVGAKIDDDLYEELESALLMSDTGVEATQYLLDALKKKVKENKLTDSTQVREALKTLFVDLLVPLQKPLELGRHQPLVMMIAGVNGAGKTTTIGKLAKHMQHHGQSVLLAAGDTFRAAAREQLAIWGERNNITVIAQESGDPAAVAFDAVSSARARGTNVVMIDTAGRLPTQLHLMDELKKIKRVIAKGMESAPHEILLVIDGNTGQNALAQVKAFDDAIGLTGLVITKLDGTAKGGILAAIAKTRPIPVYFIGVGEQIEDLQPFNAGEFVDALLS